MNGAALAAGIVHKLFSSTREISGEIAVPFALAPKLNLPPLRNVRQSSSPGISPLKPICKTLQEIDQALPYAKGPPHDGVVLEGVERAVGFAQRKKSARAYELEFRLPHAKNPRRPSSFVCPLRITRS